MLHVVCHVAHAALHLHAGWRVCVTGHWCACASRVLQWLREDAAARASRFRAWDYRDLGRLLCVPGSDGPGSDSPPAALDPQPAADAGDTWRQTEVLKRQVGCSLLRRCGTESQRCTLPRGTTALCPVSLDSLSADYYVCSPVGSCACNCTSVFKLHYLETMSPPTAASKAWDLLAASR